MPTKTSNSKSAWSAKDIYDMIFSTYGNAHVNANKARAKEASKYMIPYIPEKEIMLTTGRYNTGKISTNLLDSIYNASQRTGVPLDIALGLAGRESTLGIGRGFKKGKSVSGTDLYSNWQQIQTIPNNKAQMKKWNSLLGRTDLTDEDYDFKSGFLIRAQDSLENTKPLDENPIDNALKFYQTGKYNPGDSRYTQMVEDDAKVLMSDPAIQKWLKTKTETQMKCGGRRKAQLGLDIREGGIAIPIANNMFYIDGRKHAAGGVAIGPNNKNGVEVEGGEVVEMIDSNHPSVGRQFKAGGQQQTMRVFSSVPFLRGASPAELVLEGANPDAVFKAQEEFKDRNRINDDGTRYEVGGEKNISINNLPSSFRGRKIGNSYYQIGIPPSTNKIKSGVTGFKNYLKGLNDDLDEFGVTFTQVSKKVMPKPLRDTYAKLVNAIYKTNKIDKINTAANQIGTVSMATDKKKFGGNMIYEINGNVRNVLSLRPKAKYGLATKYLKKKDNKSEVNNIEKEEVNKVSNVPAVNPDVAKKLGLITLGTLGTIGVGGATAYGLNRFENYVKQITKPSLEISQKALDEYNEKYVRKTQGKTTKGFTPKNPLKDSKNIQYQRLNINESNIGLYDSKDLIVRATIKARGLNPERVTANGSFKRGSSNLSAIEQRKLDKDYNRVIGNKEPKSGFGAKPADKVITSKYPDTSISSKPINVAGKTYDPTVEFRQAAKPKPTPNTGLSNYLKKLGKGVRGLGVIGSFFDIYNNLFPSEEVEALENLRVKMEKTNKDLTKRRESKYGGRIKAENGKFLKYKNGVFTDPETGEEYDVDPEVFKMYGNTKESGVIPTDDYTKGTFNARPQYYAEKRLPIAGSQSIAEKAGLSRSGWSYGENPTFDYVPNINISVPTNYAKTVGDNSKKSTSSTPRGEGAKSSKATTKSIEYPSVVRRDEYYSSNEPKGNSTPVDELYVARQSRGIQAVNELSPSSTGGGTQSKDGRWIGQYKTTNVGDWIGLGSNLAGSVASYFMTKNAINKMPDPVKPVMTPAVKLKTKYNIQPQLTNISEAEQMNRATVRRNTQSSNTSLAREQRLMNEARGARNTLYGEKENIETQLINQDRLNRQSVMRDNVRAYNEYLNKVTATKMVQNEMRASNINNLISGLTGSVNSILGNIESRRATNNTLQAIAAANPNVDARLIGGFDYYIDPITKKKYNKNQQYVGIING